jgi:hypothetical protein
MMPQPQPFRAPQQAQQAHPGKGHTLSDAQRSAILDEHLKRLPPDKEMKYQIEWRSGYRAIRVCRGKPLTLFHHFGLLCLTLMSFGLGIIVWGFMIWVSNPDKIYQRLLFEVSPTGQLTQKKLPTRSNS